MSTWLFNFSDEFFSEVAQDAHDTTNDETPLKVYGKKTLWVNASISNYITSISLS